MPTGWLFVSVVRWVGRAGDRKASTVLSKGVGFFGFDLGRGSGQKRYDAGRDCVDGLCLGLELSTREVSIEASIDFESIERDVVELGS